MPPPKFELVDQLEDQPFVVVTRETDGANVAITQAGTSTISYTMFVLSSGVITSGPTSLTVASVVFDSYQTGGVWVDKNGDAIDATGYNFKHTLAGSLFPTAGQVLRLEHVYTPASGNAFTFAMYNFTVINRHTS